MNIWLIIVVSLLIVFGLLTVIYWCFLRSIRARSFADFLRLAQANMCQEVCGEVYQRERILSEHGDTVKWLITIGVEIRACDPKSRGVVYREIVGVLKEVTYWAGGDPRNVNETKEMAKEILQGYLDSANAALNERELVLQEV